MNETTILQRIRLAVGRVPGLKLFRNNCGQAWMGKIVSRTQDMIVIKDPRPVQFGLHPGSSDLIGWKSVTITPEMVGQRVAVFVSLECKTETGAVRPDQANWIDQVKAAGGLAGIVRSEADALQGLK